MRARCAQDVRPTCCLCRRNVYVFVLEECLGVCVEVMSADLASKPFTELVRTPVLLRRERPDAAQMPHPELWRRQRRSRNAFLFGFSDVAKASATSLRSSGCARVGKLKQRPRSATGTSGWEREMKRGFGQARAFV
eukprot:6181494-Pleurochrysis_carterae.AAC.1